MGFLNRLFTGETVGEEATKSADKLLKELAIKDGWTEAAWDAKVSAENAAKDKVKKEKADLKAADVKHWEDVAAGRIAPDMPSPSQQAYDALSPEEKQQVEIEKQQRLQATMNRMHNSKVEAASQALRTAQIFNTGPSNTRLLDTNLKTLMAQQPVFVPVNPVLPNSKNSDANQSANASEANEELWLRAAEEIQSGNKNEGLWIKCFSKAEGDENKAKAFYYEARVKELLANQQTALIQENLKNLESQNTTNLNSAAITDEELNQTHAAPYINQTSHNKKEDVIPSGSRNEAPNNLKMYIVVGGIALVAIFGWVLLSPNTPSQMSANKIPLNAPYINARKNLINDGWSPVKQSEGCGTLCQIFRDNGWKETLSCADSGVAPCIFIFQNKQGDLLKVFTQGEGSPTIRDYQISLNASVNSSIKNSGAMAPQSVNCNSVTVNSINTAATENVVIGSGRLQFYKKPQIDCELKGIFVIPGDYLISTASSQDGKWVEVSYTNPRNGNNAEGWVQKDRLKQTAMYQRTIKN